VIPFTLLVVLASFNSGDQRFCEIVTLCRPQPYHNLGQEGAAGSRFAGDDIELGP
jgi:hypothetical protein